MTCYVTKKETYVFLDLLTYAPNIILRPQGVQACYGTLGLRVNDRHTTRDDALMGVGWSSVKPLTHERATLLKFLERWTMRPFKKERWGM